ncbi:MAG: hypothetical protein ACK4QL_02105 [Pseudanabaenaceae cyanobacterium]
MRCPLVALTLLASSLWALPASACPTELANLAPALLADLPSYLNRTYVRIGIRDRFVVGVTRPEFEPLPVRTELPNQPQPQQLFFSVLEKRRGSQPTTSRAYWLLLTPTKHQKWELALAFARTGNAPPTDVSDGAIALAVNTWLRDKCFNPD